VTEVLCGHSFSASAISTINKSLDAALRAFAERRLTEPFPYLILDARYERVREAGIIISQAELIAVAVDGEGQRQILGVELANRESRTSWRDFLSGLKERGLFGVEFVVSDDHEGLKQAIREVLPGSATMSISCATRSTICRVSWPTIACRSCAGSLLPARARRGPRLSWARPLRFNDQGLARW
jgi:transposase-like protein